MEKTRKELQAWKDSVESVIRSHKKLEDEAVVRFIAYDSDRSGYLEFEEIKNVRFCLGCETFLLTHRSDIERFLRCS